MNDARRARLKSGPNPNPRADYLSVTEARFHPLRDGATVDLTLRYVPDRLILLGGALADYLSTHERAAWDGLEACAGAILDDLANELVPRWVQVTLTVRATVDEKLTGCLEQRVIMEDRQPSWNNADLLHRLAGK